MLIHNSSRLILPLIMAYSGISTTFIVTSIISAVAGLSVSVVSLWAIYVKWHTLQELYPEADAFFSELFNSSSSSTNSSQIWSEMTKDWEDSQDKHQAVIALAFLTGIIQFLIAMRILHVWDKGAERKLAPKFVLRNMVVLLLLVICDLITSTADNLKLPLELEEANRSFGVFGGPFISILQFGINRFVLWIAMDILFLFGCVVIISCFLRSQNSVFGSAETLNIAIR